MQAAFFARCTLIRLRGALQCPKLREGTGCSHCSRYLGAPRVHKGITYFLYCR